MAMFHDTPERPELYQKFVREVPAWYREAKFGIFVHWGAYSVPAWAEPIGELGTIDRPTWFKHNPYAEWYFNTIRIEGSPAGERQKTVYGGAAYDDFLDQWTASEWDPQAMVDLFRRVGAEYVVPTTKHHDITLWDAPGTGERNTVARGPKRDIVGEFAAARGKPASSSVSTTPVAWTGTSTPTTARSPTTTRSTGTARSTRPTTSTPSPTSRT